MDLIAYAGLAFITAVAYYFAGKYGRILWERRHRAPGRQ